MNFLSFILNDTKYEELVIRGVRKVELISDDYDFILKFSLFKYYQATVSFKPLTSSPLPERLYT